MFWCMILLLLSADDVNFYDLYDVALHMPFKVELSSTTHSLLDLGLCALIYDVLCLYELFLEVEFANCCVKSSSFPVCFWALMMLSDEL